MSMLNSTRGKKRQTKRKILLGTFNGLDYVNTGDRGLRLKLVDTYLFVSTKPDTIVNKQGKERQVIRKATYKRQGK